MIAFINRRAADARSIVNIFRERDRVNESIYFYHREKCLFMEISFCSVDRNEEIEQWRRQ